MRRKACVSPCSDRTRDLVERIMEPLPFARNFSFGSRLQASLRLPYGPEPVGGPSWDETGDWMHAFSEILLAPPMGQMARPQWCIRVEFPCGIGHRLV